MAFALALGEYSGSPFRAMDEFGTHVTCSEYSCQGDESIIPSQASRMVYQ